MIYRYALTLAYLGTRFCGWQVQPDGVSVQATVQDAVEQVFCSRLDVTGCSRTDAGVHSKGFVCLIATETQIPCDRLPQALNTYLPPDVAVIKAREVGEGFHPRYQAKCKQYSYRIHNSRVRDPFTENISWQYIPRIDETKAHELGKAYVGSHDFRAFMSVGSKITDTVREVTEFTVTRQGEDVFITVTADGFLYNMVRIMVGTLLDGLAGRLDMSISDVIISRDRENAGPTVPAKGLTLEKVFY